MHPWYSFNGSLKLPHCGSTELHDRAGFVLPVLTVKGKINIKSNSYNIITFLYFATSVALKPACKIPQAVKKP